MFALYTTISSPIPNSSSSITLILHFLSKWLKPVQHDSASGSGSVPHALTENAVDNLQSMLVDQIPEFTKIAQHLLTGDLSNQDYEAILLCHRDDMEEQREKIVNEAEREGNVDACMDGRKQCSLDEAL